MKVEFHSEEDAIAFCEKNGWKWYVQKLKEKEQKPKSYGVNFSWNKRTRVSTKWSKHFCYLRYAASVQVCIFVFRTIKYFALHVIENQWNPTRFLLCISVLSHSCHMPIHTKLPWYDHHNHQIIRPWFWRLPPTHTHSAVACFFFGLFIVPVVTHFGLFS